MISDRKSAIEIVRKVLTTDYACDERAFEDEGVFIYQAKKLEGARRFPHPEKYLVVATMGKGVVVSCSRDRLRWTRSNLSPLTSKQIFSAPAIARIQRYVSRYKQYIVGPTLNYVCTPDIFNPHTVNKDIKLSLVEGEDIKGLYADDRFPNALGKRFLPECPTVIGCLVKNRDKVIGIAAASADCDTMWQIGVDTLPDYRNRGIAKAAVGLLTEAILKKNKLPYYATGASNIASRRTAISPGYRPTWVEIYAYAKRTDSQ